MQATRKWMLLGLVLCLGISLWAAGGQEDSADAAKELSIYWNPDHYYDTYKEIIEPFAAERGYEVNLQILNWNDLKTKLNADFAAGTVPDLIEVPSPWIAEFAALGQLEDLTAEIEGWKESEDWFESTWVEVSNKGKTYGMKLHHTAFGLFYNQDHFAAAGISTPPKTLDEFAAVIAKIDQELGPDIRPFGFDPTGQYLVPFLASEETPLLIDGDQVAIDTPAVRETLKKLQAIARSGQVVVPDPGGEEARSSVRQLFFNGTMSMMISGPWEIGNIRKNFPDLNYSVAMIPSLEGTKGLTLTAGTGLAIPKNSKVGKAEVFELMKMLTSVDTEVAATLEAGMLMPRKGWANDPRVQEDRTVQLFGPILPQATPFDIGVRKLGLPEITWGGAVFSQLYQSMIYSDRDMDVVLDAYLKEANRLVKDAQ